MISILRTLVIASELVLAAGSAVAARPDALLEGLGADVMRFWEQFSAITCSEAVDQKKIDSAGKTILERKSTFDYLILLQLAGEDLMVEESRIPQGKGPKESDRPLLTTNGFSTLLLIFHPLFQPSYDFEEGGMAEWNGRSYRQVKFQHIRGHRSPSVLQLRNRDYPLEWKGVAWVDPNSAAVARIQVELKSPMEDVGLIQLSGDVQYLPVRITGDDTPRRMPQIALVEAATRRQRWRNTHTFTRYRQFQVTTESKTDEPSGAKEKNEQ